MDSPCRGERLPRKSPDKVQEHRITFGTLERQQLIAAKGEFIALERRRQNMEFGEKMLMPVALLGSTVFAVFTISNTWQLISDLIPDWPDPLDAISRVMQGDQAHKEAILQEAAQQAEQDGKPLSFWQKVRNRFAIDSIVGGGSVY